MKNNWRVPESLEKVIPVPRSLHPHLKWWLEQYAPRSAITPTKTCSADLYRCIKRRVGRSFKRTHCKGNLVPSRKQATYQLSGTKGSLSGPKRVQGPLSEQHSSGSYRQHYSGCLYKQRGGGGEVGPSVCPSLENLDLVYQETGNSQSLTHPRPAESDSRQAIQTTPHHSNRMVPPSRGFPTNMLLVAPGPSGPVYHQVQQPAFSPGLCHQSQIPRPGQWMHSVCPGKIWTHTPSHQQPSCAKWWRSCRTTRATV